MDAPPVIGESAATAAGPPRWLAGLGLACILAALWLLREFEPRGQPFYPRCWLFVLTGIECPGCGGLRAAHALLNGDVARAWSLNPLAVALAPVAGWVVLATGLKRHRGVSLPNPFGHRYAIAVLLGITVGFAIARNLR
jgi:uncharacterized membrane protein YhdT